MRKTFTYQLMPTPKQERRWRHECERLGDDYGASIYASNLEVISRAAAAEAHEP